MQTSIRRRALLGAGVAAAALPRRSRAADKPIRIGVLTDMSGSPMPPIPARARCSARRWRSRISCATHPSIKAEVVQADLQLKPDVALAIARDWYDNQGVDVVTDVPLSSAAFAIGDLAKQKDKVAIFTGAASADITGDEVRPEPPALGLRHLVDAARRGRCRGEGRRRQLVLHHRRLCVRPFAAEGRGELRHRRRRQGA